MPRFVTYILIFFLLAPAAVQAADFNPYLIISDEEMTRWDEWPEKKIGEFLALRAGALKYYADYDLDGRLKTAAKIIARAAQEHKINPKILLVTLQKEQSLLEDPKPSSDQLKWAMGYGVCDSCQKNDPGLQEYAGFAKQIDRAAWRLRYYFDHPLDFYFQINKPAVIDGQIIIPANQATANLYNYTPHLAGNRSFWRLWQRYFFVRYPEGALLKTSASPIIWKIENGFKRPFVSLAAFTSRYRFDEVIITDEEKLSVYDDGRPISLPQYSLLQTGVGDVYLLDGETIRRFASPNLLSKFGFNSDELTLISEEELAVFTKGKPITERDRYPQGALLQDKTTGGIFYIVNGERFIVPHRRVLEINFPNERQIKRVLPKEMNQYPLKGIVKIRDRVLIKTQDEPSVYLTHEGRRLPIASAKTFTDLGYQWNRIEIVPKQIAELLPLGPMIE